MGRPSLSSFEKNLRHEIALNLKRISQGKTQAQISDMTGIPASTVSGYFSERSTIKEDNLKKIAEAFGVDPGEIDPRVKKIDWDKHDSKLTPKHFNMIEQVENAPTWATEEDILDLEKMLNSNVSMAFGGEELTEDDKEKVKNVLTGIFWERLEKQKKKDGKM